MKQYFLKRNKFQCSRCTCDFEVWNFWKWLFAPHLFDIWRYIKCPLCHKRNWMKRVKLKNVTKKGRKKNG